MNKLYRIYRYDKNRNREILAGGIDKKTAEKALEYAGYDPKKVNWRAYPSDFFIEIYEGEYIE